jgi:hypothetical protein
MLLWPAQMQWNGNYLGRTIFISEFSNRFCSSENLISEAKNYLQMLDRQGFNTRTNAI